MLLKVSIFLFVIDFLGWLSLACTTGSGIHKNENVGWLVSWLFGWIVCGLHGQLVGLSDG